jgi:3-hydroxyacyl-CoA dehydrogenase/3a,7a,12a-trihydroxy-5b-cholest-24-enoyl-CoA hydratase
VPEAKAKEAKPKVEPSAAGEPTSAVVFGVIRDYVAAHPELVAKVATVFKFELTNPDSVYTIDLRSGSVGEGETAKPECTLRLTDADFMAMTKGAADPQKLFMEGRLKISGNIMASQKLSFLKQIDPKAAPAKKAAAAEPSRGAAKAPAIFERVAKRSPKRAGGARLAFRVTEPASDWVVDLAAGSVERGAGSADATLTLTDEDLEALTQGAEPRELFQRGRLRIEGTLARARDLAFLREA